MVEWQKTQVLVRVVPRLAGAGQSISQQKENATVRRSETHCQFRSLGKMIGLQVCNCLRDERTLHTDDCCRDLQAEIIVKVFFRSC